MDKDLLFIQTILSDEMISQGFPLVYKGSLSHKTMKFFTSMAEGKVAERCTDNSVKRKVFHVMVEMLQNVTRHSADTDEHGSGNGIFVIGERKDYFYVITGNTVKTTDVRDLEDSIEALNSSSREQLNDLHKQQIKHSKLSVKGGAGLGLIDIVRKTGEKFVYQFLRLDSEYHFFVLKATVHF